MVHIINISLIILIAAFVHLSNGEPTPNWCLLRIMQIGTLAIRAADFSPNGEYLASTHDDGSVYIWDTTTWSMILNLNFSTIDIPYAVRFSKDGTKLAIGYDNARLRVINTTTWQQTVTLMTSHIRINEIDWS